MGILGLFRITAQRPKEELQNQPSANPNKQNIRSSSPIYISSDGGTAVSLQHGCEEELQDHVSAGVRDSGRQVS